jgi:Tfp pilus assembly protein PilN
MNKLLEKYDRPKQVAVVEITFLPDGNLLCRVMVFEKEKQQVRVVKTPEEGLSLAAAADFVGTALPFMLLLKGKGILSKIVSRSEKDDRGMLLDKAMPNASSAGLCAQFNLIDESEVQVLLIRSALLDSLAAELEKQKMTKLILCNLDPSGEPAALAAAYFSGNENGISDHAGLNKLQEEHRAGKLFRAKAIGMLVAAFVILILNYFVYEHYRSACSETSMKLELSQGALDKYEQLKRELARKKIFLDQNGFLGSAQTSFYADRLAAALPEEVDLTGLQIHPLRKKKAEEEDQGLQFESRKIIVEGNCRKGISLNNWIKTIRKMNWVANVALINYAQDNEKDAGNFSVGIELK